MQVSTCSCTAWKQMTAKYNHPPIALYCNMCHISFIYSYLSMIPCVLKPLVSVTRVVQMICFARNPINKYTLRPHPGFMNWLYLLLGLSFSKCNIPDPTFDYFVCTIRDHTNANQILPFSESHGLPRQPPLELAISQTKNCVVKMLESGLGSGAYSGLEKQIKCSLKPPQ